MQEGGEYTKASTVKVNITVLSGSVMESRMYYCHIYYRYLNEICSDYGNACKVMEIGDEIMRLFVPLLSLLWFTTNIL